MASLLALRAGNKEISPQWHYITLSKICAETMQRKNEGGQIPLFLTLQYIFFDMK
jgi:hypothetical protein